ncbi:MAG TPA: hypothetical protein VGM50_16660 [Gemmatimonadaceae bacterium]
MESAVDGLAEALDQATFADPHFVVYANVNAEPVTGTARAKALLIDQLSKPVQWICEVQAMAAKYPDALFVEMGPGSVLAGLIRKIAPSVKTMTCGTAAEVQQLRELAAH